MYTYSSTTKRALAWTELKQIVEKYAGTKFNSCLLNLYHNEGMGWHSDDENPLGKNNTIASLSFGAERKFSFKHKQTKQTVSLVLELGKQQLLFRIVAERENYARKFFKEHTTLDLGRLFAHTLLLKKSIEFGSLN